MRLISGSEVENVEIKLDRNIWKMNENDDQQLLMGTCWEK